MRLQAVQIRVLLGKGGETIKQICGEPLMRSGGLQAAKWFKEDPTLCFEGNLCHFKKRMSFFHSP